MHTIPYSSKAVDQSISESKAGSFGGSVDDSKQGEE